MRLKFKKLHPDAILPVYATNGAAGMDLHACLPEPVVLQSGEAAAVPTGLAMELSDNYSAEIRGRSGLAFKHAVFAFTGTLDADYRGEIKVLLINHSKVPFTIEPNMRIAQMVVNAAVVRCRPDFVDELGVSERGVGGFGSTGLMRLHHEDNSDVRTFHDENQFQTLNIPLDIPNHVPYSHTMGDKPLSAAEVEEQLLNVSKGKA